MKTYTCNGCGKVHFPKYVICQHCGGRDFTEGTLEGKAKLLSWTRVSSLPVGFDEPHRNFGVVQFENGVTATGVVAFEDMEIGMTVLATEGVIRTVGEEEIMGLVLVKA